MQHLECNRTPRKFVTSSNLHNKINHNQENGKDRTQKKEKQVEQDLKDF